MDFRDIWELVGIGRPTLWTWAPAQGVQGKRKWRVFI